MKDIMHELIMNIK